MGIVRCILWYAGDPCSQTALEKVRSNIELARLTALADVRNPRCQIPPSVTLVPTLSVLYAGGVEQAFTGKQVHHYARVFSTRQREENHAVLTATDLRFAEGTQQLESRAEIVGEYS